ncbi:Phage-related protein, predicted endonuclease [Thalassospira xiamenensis M-5 = DSM 17429]|nr:Phage-related protein, predicted endonuclease [Thalassospira xiamenensis M-5 = DSM 17429]
MMTKLDRTILAPVVEKLTAAVIKNFYQKEHLSEGLVGKWIWDVLADQRFDDKTPRAAAEEIKWLVRRGSGLSGSEIAPLILDKFNKFHPFSSTREVVAQKLFKHAPFQDPRYFVDTQRGHKIEDIARARFREIAPSMGLRPNDGIIDTLRNYRHPTISSMIGTPDEAADDLINHNTIVIADYKAPRPNGTQLEPRDFSSLVSNLLTPENEELLPVDENDGKLFDYFLQMHQYGILERERRGDPDVNIRLILVRWCGVRGDIVIDELPWSEDIAQMICETHKEIWADFVMTGTLPEFRKLPELDERDVSDELQELSSHYVMAKMLENAAKEVASEIQGKFKEWVSATGYLSTKLMLGYLDVTGKPQYEEEAIINLAIQYGIDPDEFRGPSKSIDYARTLEEIATLLKDHSNDVTRFDRIQSILDAAPVVPGSLDTEKLAKAILDAGGDPTFIRDQSIAFRTPQGKSERAQTVKAVKSLAKKMLQSMIDASISRGPDDMAEITARMSDSIKALKDEEDLSTADLIERVNIEIAHALQNEVVDTSFAGVTDEFDIGGEGQAPTVSLPPVPGGFPTRPVEADSSENPATLSRGGFSGVRGNGTEGMLYDM